MSTIRDQVGACTYLTASVPGATGAITVSIGSAPVAEGVDWTWSDRANGEILFGADACVAARGGASLSVEVRCH